jgi:hypothetical protein
VDSPQNFIWSDVTLRDLIGEESADERYVVIRRTHGSRPEGAGQVRVRRRNGGQTLAVSRRYCQTAPSANTPNQKTRLSTHSHVKAPPTSG